MCHKKTHHGGGALFVNQECWWNLVWQPSTEPLCWEAGDQLIRAEESIETAPSAVNHLVFSKTKTTIGSHAEDFSSRDHPNEKQSLSCRKTAEVEMATGEELVQMTRDLEVDCREPTVPHQDWRRLQLLWNKQFEQRWPMQTHEQMNVRVSSTSRVSGIISKLHRVAQEDHRVSDRCVQISFSATG